MTKASSKRHKHEWALIDSYDSGKRKRPSLPKGQWVQKGGLFGGVTYIPGFDKVTFYEHLVDSINSSYEPTYTSQTWACECGKTKTHTQKHESPFKRLLGDKANDLAEQSLADSTDVHQSAKNNSTRKG